MRGSPGPNTGTRTNRMQSALALGVSFFNCRASPRNRRLARIEWFSRLGLGESSDSRSSGPLAANRCLAGTRTARPLRKP